MIDFFADIVACEFCSKEYISAESSKITDMPKDQKKTEKIQDIIHQAIQIATKPCIRFACKEQSYDIVVYHNICYDHLVQMLNTIHDNFGTLKLWAK